MLNKYKIRKQKQ